MGRYRVWAITLACVAMCGCAGSLGKPRPVNVVADQVFTHENARLTERSELLSRVEPFVGIMQTSENINVPATAIMQVTVALPKEGVLLRSPNTASGLAGNVIPTGEQYWINASNGTIPLDAPLFTRLLLDYRDDRVLQIDRACTAYFSGLDGISGNVDFGRSIVNIGGDYVTVLMGLAGSPARQLAILAGGQAAFNQSVDATRSLLLLNPAPSAVRALVNASQRRLLTDSQISATPTYAGVESQIQAYALACTPIGIRAIVNEAITQRAQVEDPDRTSPIGQALLVELTTMLNAGQAEAQKVAQIDEQAAAFMLWVASTPDCSTDACDAFKRTAERYPALITRLSRLGGTKPTFLARLNDLAAAEPSIGARRDFLQANLVSEKKDADHLSALQTANATIAGVREQLNEKDQQIKQLNDELRQIRANSPVTVTTPPIP